MYRFIASVESNSRKDVAQTNTHFHAHLCAFAKIYRYCSGSGGWFSVFPVRHTNRTGSQVARAMMRRRHATGRHGSVAARDWRQQNGRLSQHSRARTMRYDALPAGGWGNARGSTSLYIYIVFGVQIWHKRATLNGRACFRTQVALRGCGVWCVCACRVESPFAIFSSSTSSSSSALMAVHVGLEDRSDTCLCVCSSRTPPRVLWWTVW